MSGTDTSIRTKRSLRVAVQVITVVFVLALVVGFVSFKQYVEESPRFCQSCHVVAPEIALWMESEHRSVRCQECHHQTLKDGLHILKTYLSQGVPAELHAQVDVKSCSGCHESHDGRWPSIADSAGHRVHTREVGLVCTTCHGAEMHFHKPARATCAGCHEDMRARPPHGDDHCIACHNFLSEEEVIRPQRRDCLRCHRTSERPIKVSDTAPMQFACSTCHRPHADEMVPCTDCHKPVELPGLHGSCAPTSDCGVCHEPHEWVSTREHCFNCHEGLEGHHPSEQCGKCHRFEERLTTGP